MPASRVKLAWEADARLRAMGAPKLGGLFYPEYPKEIVAQMFVSTSKINKIKLTDQLNVTRKIRYNMKKITFEEKFPWVYAYKWFGEDEEVYVKGRCPIVGVDEKTHRMIEMIGINLSGVNERFTPNTIFTILRRDKFWRAGS